MKEMIKQSTKERIFLKSTLAINCYNDSINDYLKWNEEDNASNEFIKFGLYISMLGSDFAVLIKQYMVANQCWEEILIAQQLYIKINESVKKIIGFETNGSTKSYWIKIVGE